MAELGKKVGEELIAGLLASGAPSLSESEMQPDDLSVVTMTQTVTMNATEPVASTC